MAFSGQHSAISKNKRLRADRNDDVPDREKAETKTSRSGDGGERATGAGGGSSDGLVAAGDPFFGQDNLPEIVAAGPEAAGAGQEIILPDPIEPVAVFRPLPGHAMRGH